MAREDRANEFVQTFVLEFGFLSGAFFAIGIDPEPASIGIQILNVLNNLFPNSNTSTWISWLIIAGLVSTAVTLIGAWRIGKGLGYISIALAGIGGYTILKFPKSPTLIYASLFLVFLAIVLGRLTVK